MAYSRAWHVKSPYEMLVWGLVFTFLPAAKFFLAPTQQNVSGLVIPTAAWSVARRTGDRRALRACRQRAGALELVLTPAWSWDGPSSSDDLGAQRAQASRGCPLVSK